MKIQCILNREGGSKVEIGGIEYHFAPQADGAHVADVRDNAHIQRFLSIPEGYRIYGEPEDQDGDTNTDDERLALVAEYEAKFGKKPHHKASIETIRKQLEE
jgi:hypothetical protein